MPAKKKRKRAAPRAFRQVTAADVTDEKLLLGEFRAFRAEVAGILREILPALKRMNARDDDIQREQVAQHAEHADHRGQLAGHRGEIDGIKTVLAEHSQKLTALDERTKGT